MIDIDILVIGGGPAGLSAASSAARAGAQVMLIERDRALGGQLVKQTHMFFGSEQQHASVRGIDIAVILKKEVATQENIRVLTSTNVAGIYEDGVVTLDHRGEYLKVRPQAVIVATGASEKYLSFVNNDLPGIYGAGAVQTLMNVYGVKPGKRVLMVGAGNIGLIVSYQLLQAGVEVAAVIDAAPTIGGYLVHAAKIRRLGVPIFTRRTIKKAHGTDHVIAATTVALDDQWQPVPGSEETLDVDVICIAVGLSPLTELLGQAGVKMRYTPELGGYAPLRDSNLMTSQPGFFVAGDAAGIEEASAAMVEGRLAGIAAANWIGIASEDSLELQSDLKKQLQSLRAGPEGEKTRQGLAHVVVNSTDLTDCHLVKSSHVSPSTIGQLERTGIPDEKEATAEFPSLQRLEKGPVVVVECLREIPCDPCAAACPQGAIAPFADINHRPIVDHSLCTGCALCISQCPGLAIRVVDYTWSDAEALIRLPYEFLPRPQVGDRVDALGRDGQPLTEARVIAVWDHPSLDRTMVVSIAIAKEYVRDTVAMTVKPKLDDENTIICRCSDVTQKDIRIWVEKGVTSLEEIKRLTRAGMGPCQGKTCSLLVAREIARLSGLPLETISGAVDRPLTVGVRMGDIIRGQEGEEQS